MDRFDIPEDVSIIINKGIEIDLIDGADVIALGIKFGDDWDAIVNTIISFAYSNIHWNNDHDIIAPLANTYHKNKC